MSNLNSSLEVLFSKMEGFISSKTVVGEPINIGDVIIVPLVDISVGVGAGSYERKEKNNENSGGGLGAKISPSAMLVVQNGSVQLVDVKNQNSVNKLIDMVPGVVSKFNISSFFKKDDIEENIGNDIEDKE
ncbi:GerW family sporulation protein [[Clostridium] colinum]|uniref:GerW family sporulation protein n=1 Tax=[Clostridium] colinum TaxID=36835 RepID=UPI0020246EE2|nr:GerW family sporulation protein [[Clostridium] colinum]